MIDRLTQLVFPAYAHRPGRTPHPRLDARGHSFGVAEPAIRSPGPPELWDRCDLYLQGVDLFNAGFWWEAHETWEALWKGLPVHDNQAMFLRGLIQAAAACLKRCVLSDGSSPDATPEGIERLLTRADANLRPVLSLRPLGRYMGLDVGRWWANVQDFARGRSGVWPSMDLSERDNRGT